MVIITSWFAIAARSRVLARLVVSLAQIGELARRLNQQQSKRRLEHSFCIVKQLPFHFAQEILKKCLNIPKHFLNISKNPLNISKYVVFLFQKQADFESFMAQNFPQRGAE